MNSVHSDVKLVETRSSVSIVTTALPSNLVNPHVKFVESFMDDTCRGKHEWTFEFDSTYKRAPGGGIHFCKQCGCLNELVQIQVQGECEYGASFNPEGRLLWRAHVPRWGESFTQMRPSEIRARTNVEQIFGVIHQDGLPKRAIRTARRLFLFPTTLCGVLVFDSVSRVASLPPPASHLSRTIFVHHLCQPPSFTHHLSHTPSLTHHLCQPSLSTTIFHTSSLSTIFVHHLCQPSFTHHLSHTTSHTPSLSTTIYHTPSFTHHFCQPSLSTTIFVNHHLSHTISHTPSLTHIFVNHHLSHTILVNHLAWQVWLTSTFVLRGRRGTHGTGWRAWARFSRGWRRGTLRGRRGTWSHPPFVSRGRRGTISHSPWFCVAGVALMALGGLLGRGRFSRGWRRGTLRGRRGTWSHPPFVSRGMRGTISHSPWFCVAGVDWVARLGPF